MIATDMLRVIAGMGYALFLFRGSTSIVGHTSTARSWGRAVDPWRRSSSTTLAWRCSVAQSSKWCLTVVAWFFGVDVVPSE